LNAILFWWQGFGVLVPTKKQAKIRNNKDTREVLELASGFRADVQRYICLRFGDTDLAEKVTQEAFVRFLELQNPGKIENPRGYLLRIAANLGIDHLRRENHRIFDRSIEVGSLEVKADQASPEEVLLGFDLQWQLASAMKTMPEKCRTVFILRRFEGLTTVEIADQLGVSRRMIQKHLAQAMQHLHVRLKD
jgi:RNA polymerase sigma factor (sigma-70 family)